MGVFELDSLGARVEFDGGVPGEGSVVLVRGGGFSGPLGEVAVGLAGVLFEGCECRVFAPEGVRWTVEEVRDFLLPGLRVSSDGLLCVVVEGVDAMAGGVVDRLLKPLEEGAGRVFWLCAGDGAGVGATLRGRVTLEMVAGAGGGDGVASLVGEGFSEGDVRLALDVFGGRVWAARRLLERGCLGEVGAISAFGVGGGGFAEAEEFVGALTRSLVGGSQSGGLDAWSAASPQGRSVVRQLLLSWFSVPELPAGVSSDVVLGAFERQRQIAEFRRLVLANTNPVHALSVFC